MNQEAEQNQETEQQPLDFKNYHLHIAMPCYAGQVSEPTMSSLFKFILVANQLGLEWSFDSISNESLVTRARCNLMSKMMANKSATHFMFIDSDIRFEPRAIFQMLAADKEIIGGLYPKKVIQLVMLLTSMRRQKCKVVCLLLTLLATDF